VILPPWVQSYAARAIWQAVYFRRESEPYMTLALTGTRRDAGVSVAENDCSQF
jgi:hypothetical protein